MKRRRRTHEKSVQEQELVRLCKQKIDADIVAQVAEWSKACKLAGKNSLPR